MFRTRLLSGIVLVIIALVLVITGGDVLLAGLFAVSMVGLSELYRVFHIERTLLGMTGYLLYESWRSLYSRNRFFCFGFLDFGDGSLCYAVSQVQGGSGLCCVCGSFLCGRDVVWHIPDQNDGEGRIYCLADFFMFLGQRYVCVLRWRPYWQT